MEVMVVAVLIVLLFPPRELPKIARTVAQMYGQLRKTADDFRSAVMMDDELRAPIREIRSVYHDARYEIEKTRTRVQDEFERASKDLNGEDDAISLGADDHDDGPHDEDHHDDDLDLGEVPQLAADEASTPPAATDEEPRSAPAGDPPTSAEHERATQVNASHPPPRRVQITAAKRPPRMRTPSGRVAQGLESTPTSAEPTGLSDADAPRDEGTGPGDALPVAGSAAVSAANQIEHVVGGSETDR